MCRLVSFLRPLHTQCVAGTFTDHRLQAAGTRIPPVKSAWEGGFNPDPMISNQGDSRQSRRDKVLGGGSHQIPTNFKQDAQSDHSNQGADSSVCSPDCQIAEFSSETIDVISAGKLSMRSEVSAEKPCIQASRVEGLWKERSAEEGKQTVADQESQPFVWEVDVADFRITRKARPKSAKSSKSKGDYTSVELYMLALHSSNATRGVSSWHAVNGTNTHRVQCCGVALHGGSLSFHMVKFFPHLQVCSTTHSFVFG